MRAIEPAQTNLGAGQPAAASMPVGITDRRTADPTRTHASVGCFPWIRACRRAPCASRMTLMNNVFYIVGVVVVVGFALSYFGVV
jgi:hypothetical protein